jgi:type I restriction enzyme S subunit
MSSERPLESKTGGRAATTGVIPGDFSISVGNPKTPLADGWRWVLLSDVARLETGHTPSRKHPEYWGGDVPWIGIRDATGNHGQKIFATAQYTNELGIRNSSARILPANTVCLSRTASVGYVVVMGIPMATSQDFVNWVCGADLDYRFLKYVLLGERNSFLRFASGTTHQTIYFPEVKAIHIALPDIGVQRGIADMLSVLDDRITLLRETNATLEAIAQALFKSWFVDFDPVRANMANLQHAGIDAAVAAMFPDDTESTEHGEIPEGWRYAPLREMVHGVYDGPHATPPEAAEGGVFLGIKNLTGTGLDLTEVRHISDADWSQWTKRVTPHHGDIVFSYEATLGFFALVPPKLRCCLGRRLALVRPLSNSGTPHFWFHQFVAPPFQRLLDKHTIQGATVNRIALKSFPDLPVLVPPLELREAFERVAAPIWRHIHENSAQAMTLTELRDALLPRLVSGQLRLPQLEGAAETA